MGNKRQLTLIILLFLFLTQASLLQTGWADDWVQTTQIDFDSAAKTDVDITSSPGDIILSQNWMKYPLTYVLDKGSSGSWDDYHVYNPSILYDDSTYKMWYTGNNGTNSRIGYATSSDGIIWTKHPSNPVLDLGTTGAWDDADVFCPDVLYDGSMYHMWFAGDNGSFKYRIGYASSPDGISWTKFAGNPVLDIGPPGSWDDNLAHTPWVIFDGVNYHMWYSGHDGTNRRIGYASSLDGLVWTKNASNPVLDLGASGSWDDYHVQTPAVLYDGSNFKMWYVGNDGSKYRTGYATSIDGIIWTKHPANPILDVGSAGSWDVLWAAISSVLYNNVTGTYHLWYTGNNGSNFRIGYATSYDGVNWTKLPSAPVVDLGLPGSWDDERSFYPFVMKDGATYKMWYTGFDGNAARICYATSSDGISWIKNPNPVLDIGTPGSWDDEAVDSSCIIKDGGEYKMWYYAHGNAWRIGYANSTDGINWVKYTGNPVLSVGPSGSWDDNSIAFPWVIKEGSVYKMWYGGRADGGGLTYRIGYATSTDGLNWIKYHQNPVMDFGQPGEWDESGVPDFSINFHDGIYKMHYTGWNDSIAKIGYATSTDGINWTRYHDNPILDVGPSGSWDDESALYPSSLYEGNQLKMWYTGSDGTYMRIGYAEMSYRPHGNLVSSVFDSQSQGSFWNFLNWTEYLPLGTNITIAVRSGDTPTPDVSWEPWSQEMWNESYSTITLPRSRYIQYRATLTTANRSTSPILSEVIINYTLNTASSPTLIFPANDILTLDNTPTFQWIFNDNEGDSQSGFSIQIDNDLSFSSVDYFSGNVNSGSFLWTPSFPISDGIWHWRVRVRDSYDVWSEYSNSWIIKIDTTPPSVTDITVKPMPQEVNEFVNVSVIVTDNFEVDEVWINISQTGNYSMQFDAISGRYYFNGTYDTYGIYPFTIWANDTLNNMNFAVSSLSISDLIPPLIVEANAAPNPQQVFGFVNISADITDDNQLFGTWVEIYYPIGSLMDNISLSYDIVDMKYYWNQTYDMIGSYTFKILANDTYGNWAEVTDSFAILDSIPPLITNVLDYPDPQEILNTVNISCNVTDNYQLSKVMVEIHNPNGELVGNFSMITGSSMEIFYWNQTYDILGTYSYTIWANDTSNNIASFKGSFEIITKYPPIIHSITVILNPQTGGSEVGILANITDEDTDLLDLTVRINITSPEGVSLGNLSMIYISVNYNFTYSSYFDTKGTYSFKIWANDPDDNWASENGTFEIENEKEPEEYNWKPIIALTFTLILLIIGIVVVYNQPVKFTGEINKDRRQSFIFGVLPFACAEGITGIISFLTGFLAVPPILGLGMIVDLTIFILGLVSITIIYKKGKSTFDFNEDMEPKHAMEPEEEMDTSREDNENILKTQEEEIPPHSPSPPMEPPPPPP